MLQGNPNHRPSVDDILTDDFFKYGYLPPKLPTTCLTIAPRFSAELLLSAVRKPLSDIHNSKFLILVGKRVHLSTKKRVAYCYNFVISLS